VRAIVLDRVGVAEAFADEVHKVAEREVGRLHYRGQR